MTKREVLTLWKAFLCLILICVFLALNACTIARYTDETHTLTILDLHPTGNTVSLAASLEGKGQMSLNREQGSAEGIVSEVAGAVTPSPLD